MDEQQINILIQALQGTLIGSKVQEATQIINQYIVKQGFCVSMMMIANNSSLDIYVRQSAMTNLSQCIKQFWNPVDPQNSYMISQQDKGAIKGSILDALINVANEKAIVKIYETIIYDLIALEYPQNWQGLLETLSDRLVNSQNFNEIYACLIFVRQAYSVHQVFQGEERKLFNEIITKTYPGLVKVSSILANNYNENTAEMVRQVLKCYCNAIHFDIIPLLSDKDQISNWMCFVKIILDYNLPQELIQKTDNLQKIEELKKNVLWKNKKWCGKIVNRFIQKYCNPLNVSHINHQKHIPKLFLDNFSVSFLESLVSILFKNQTEFVSPQIIHFALKYVLYSIRYQKTYDVIAPHQEKLMFDICIPLCSHNQSDEELYRFNADEYLRKEDDYNTNTHQNKNCAVELIERICAQKDNNNKPYLFTFVNFASQCLDNNQDPRTQQTISIAQREGLLWIFGRLKDQIIKQKDLENLMEIVLSKYILPEFDSSSGLLRSRACWVFGRYNMIEYKNQENIKIAVQGICKCLQDKEMPVKIRAAIALESLVQLEQAQSFLKPHLENIFKIYIELMNESDSDGLVDALQGIVKGFQSELSPFAMGLVQHLCDSFQKYVMNNAKQQEEQGFVNQEEEDETSCQKAAVSCLDAITNILDSGLQTSVYSQMEEFLCDVIDFCLLDTNMRYTEEAIGILNLMVYNQQEISTKLWFYYPYLIYSILGTPPDFQQQITQFNGTNSQQQLLLALAPQGFLQGYMEHLMSPIKNFISKGKAQFFQMNDFCGNNFFQLVKTLIQQTLNTFDQQQNGELQPNYTDMAILSTLYIAIIENNPGTIDNYLPDILSYALRFSLQKDMDRNLRIVCIEIIALSMYFNPQFTFQYLQNQNVIEPLYNDWIALLPHFKHDYDKGRALLGLASVLKLEQNQIPQQMGQIMKLLVKEMVKLTGEILEARNRTDSDFESDSDFDDEDDDMNGNNIKISDQDATAFHKTLNKLQKYSQQMNGQQNGYNQNYNANNVDDDIDEDFSDDDYDLEETIGQNFRYDSPFDKECEILLFDQILQNLNNQNSQVSSYIISQLDQQEQAQLKKNIDQAKKEWEEGQQDQNL
ncbi:Armadillo-type fold [Pseudocohnilembus persalinus]|uniref:Armadillo-type fold n=1 Tax=Pseudocohnilembus persalinus TaxID=266149 RepID=A0A0V0R9B1_PSEPJ|nr:Armadillo-type fold [Pseudocohnilembus persalinus]|eukprot:KRX11054.1 Armadillo-type fold [Pseudocohnilembus persalinus]